MWLVTADLPQTIQYDTVQIGICIYKYDVILGFIIARYRTFLCIVTFIDSHLLL